MSDLHQPQLTPAKELLPDKLGAAGFALVTGSVVFLCTMLGVAGVLFLTTILVAFSGRDVRWTDAFQLLSFSAVFAVGVFLTGAVLGVVGVCRRVDSNGLAISRVMSAVTVIVAGGVIVLTALILMSIFVM